MATRIPARESVTCILLELGFILFSTLMQFEKKRMKIWIVGDLFLVSMGKRVLVLEWMFT